MLSLLTIAALAAASVANAVFSIPIQTSTCEPPDWYRSSVETFVSGKFGADFEDGAKTYFRWSDSAKTLHANLERLLGKKGNNGIHFAKDGYLIERPAAYNKDIVSTNLDAAISLAKRGEYNVSIAVIPTAFEILQDYLPAHAYDDREVQVLDAVKEYEHIIPVCDTRTALEAAKEDYIYYRTDNHLTTEGSYHVYNALGYTLWYEPYPIEDFNIEVMSENFKGATWEKSPVSFVKADSLERYILPGSQNQTLEEWNGMRDSIYELDSKDSYYVFPGRSTDSVIHSDCGETRRIAVIKDSYANSIAPFLANHFAEVHLIDLKYFSKNISEYLKNNEITDVLILYSSDTFNTDTSLTKLN